MNADEKNDVVMPTMPVSPIQIEGYQNIGFVQFADSNNQPPAPQPAENRANFQNVPFLSEDEAKEAFAKYVSEHCCYGKGPVKGLVFTNLQSSNTYRYNLQTYTEERSTSYAAEPYAGQIIYNNGMPPPQPWDIMVQPKLLFNNEVAKVEIPNTAHVEPCGQCSGVGSKVCFSCNGCGTKTCSFCSGSGRISNGGGTYSTFDDHHHHHDHNDHHRGPHHHHHHDHNPHGHHTTCSHCHGSGSTGCNTCHRTGRTQCFTCRGSGRLKWFLQLTVTFRNNQDDFLRKSESIPDDLIRTCQAQNIFSEQQLRVCPISHHPDQAINQASVNLIQNHLAKYSNSRIIAQRHDVTAIPVTLCNYTWNEKNYQFHVYGLDQRVYAPDYPKKCCCTIL